MSTWQPEQIPDEDRLFMRVHTTWIPRGEVSPGAFQNRPAGATGMSTDWQRYSTPEQTRQRSKKPSEQAVIELIVGEVRAYEATLTEIQTLQTDLDASLAYGNDARTSELLGRFDALISSLPVAFATKITQANAPRFMTM